MNEEVKTIHSYLFRHLIFLGQHFHTQYQSEESSAGLFSSLIHLLFSFLPLYLPLCWAKQTELKEAEKRNGSINNTNTRTRGGGQFCNSRIWSNRQFYLAASFCPRWERGMKQSCSRCRARSCCTSVWVYFHIHHTHARTHAVRDTRLG